MSEQAVAAIVDRVVREYAAALEARHLAERDDPTGTLNSKIHNVFVAALGPQVQYWSAMSRSLDSSFGGMLERLGLEIAALNFGVQRSVSGYITTEQARYIAEICEDYRTKRRRPAAADCEALRGLGKRGDTTERHYADFYLVDTNGGHHLIELKAGGDLDNKKAASEKQAILTQYAILVNNLAPAVPVRLYFATAYNKYGENKPWTQGSVRQVFAPEELLIGRDFWNFVCTSPEGYTWVIAAFNNCAPALAGSLMKIQTAYGLT